MVLHFYDITTIMVLHYYNNHIIPLLRIPRRGDLWRAPLGDRALRQDSSPGISWVLWPWLGGWNIHRKRWLFYQQISGENRGSCETQCSLQSNDMSMSMYLYCVYVWIMYVWIYVKSTKYIPKCPLTEKIMGFGVVPFADKAMNVYG